MTSPNCNCKGPCGGGCTQTSPWGGKPTASKCETLPTVPLGAVIHDCGMVHKKCTIMKFEGLFYVALQANATGNPNSVDTAGMWSDGYPNLNGNLLNLAIECAKTPVVDTDTVCKTTVESVNGSMTFIERCYNAVTDALISTTTLFTLPAATIDTFGQITPNPAIPGQLLWTPAGATSPTLCFYDCDYVDCIKGTLRSDNTNEYGVVDQVAAGAANTPTWDVIQTKTYTSADLEAMGKRSCHNSVSIRADASAEIENLDEATANTSSLFAGMVFNDLADYRFKAGAGVVAAQDGSDGSQEFDQLVPLRADGSLKVDYTLGITERGEVDKMQYGHRFDIMGFECKEIT